MTSNDNRTHQWEKKKYIRRINVSDGRWQFVKREPSLKRLCGPHNPLTDHFLYNP